MDANSYVGMVPPDIPRLIAARARCYRVRADEIDDLQQQIVPLLAEFHFDPARANGATLVTAMTAVIDHQIKAHLRSARRYRQRLERAQSRSGSSTRQSEDMLVHRAMFDLVDLRIDLQQVISRLSPRDRQICRGLSDGFTIKAIARQLGCGRYTVSRGIARIRRVFETAGLRAWIDANCGGGPAARRAAQ